MRAGTPDRAPWHASTRVRVGALAIVAVAAGVTIAVIVGSGAGSATTQVTVTPIDPVALSAAGLKIRVADLDQVIYWVGPMRGYKYELTRTTTDEVYVRYLPSRVRVGSHQGRYLVVATYPFTGALAAVKAVDNGKPLEVAGHKGAIAAVEAGKPTNVRVAFPHVRFQIEIYDPSPKKARTWATSAALVPVR